MAPGVWRHVDGNVRIARQLARNLDNVADDVMAQDRLEQQQRMTKDPENPFNIFVLKFGAQEEQHWRLPYNKTTNLLCHMEPNFTRYSTECSRSSR